MSSDADSPDIHSDVAIVGMAGHFPGAQNIGELWRNLRGGVESIRPLNDAELRAAGVEESTLSDPRYVKSCAPLGGLELFDAGFFGFSPKEAAILDPQHRHFLECAWEAIEDSGHDPGRFPGPIGVFAGCGMNAYFMFHILTNPRLVDSVGLFLLRHTGNDKDFLTTRVSYCFNLKGPSVGIQTACSTSLVAVHAACQSLLAGECDMALAGGVTIELPHHRGYFYEEGEILSPDGHCRAFDAQSKGTVFGSGAGIVVLRRLADALEDGDQVYAVIKGSAVNNDGSSKVGYLAPSVDGQAKAVAEAIAVAGVSPETITYVEAHGTGTPVGDPIEVAALTQAFAQQTKKTGYCAIGSLKSNMGHLDTAAGVASLMKAALALRHREIPPSLHFSTPNPSIDFPSSPFFVNAALRPWAAGSSRRRAGVNSLGVGGTNAHVILEEAPDAAPAAPGKPWNLLVLSARSPAALENAASRLAQRLEEEPGLALADVAWTLQTGRKAFSHRRAVACRTAAEAVQLLRSPESKRSSQVERLEEDPSVVFLFPGGGAQFPGMGVELYRDEPVYRQEADRCFEWIERELKLDLRSLVFPDGDPAAAALELEKPSRSVLSVFATEYALARLWMSLGVQPAAMTGHSLGEYVAACLAGVFSVEDALRIVAIRGEIFDRMPEGGMLSVPLSEGDLKPLLNELSIAAVNGPELCVASGPTAAIDALEKRLATQDVEAKRVRISVAAHSTMIDAFLDEFSRRLESVRFRAPERPYISNLTGGWAKAEDVSRRDYWVRHLRSTVRYSDGLRTILEGSGRVLVEVGPGTALTSLARLHLPPAAAPRAVSSLRHPQQPITDSAAFLAAVGRVWGLGHEIDWSALHGKAKRRRVSLPAYPFEHQRHWIEPGRLQALAGDAPAGSGDARTHAAAAVEEVAPLAKLASIDNWFSRPVWKRAGAPEASPAGRERWLVFAHGEGLSAQVIEKLSQAGQDVVTVRPGERFAPWTDRAFTVAPGRRADFEQLFGELAKRGWTPGRIVVAWPCAKPATSSRRLDSVGATQALGFQTLISIVQAIGSSDLSAQPAFDVVTAGLESVDGEATLGPETATLLGPARVLRRELDGAACRTIDLQLSDLDASGAAMNAAADRLVRELMAAPRPDAAEMKVALRGADRWVESDEPVTLPNCDATAAFPRPGATYLITGGLGDLGLELAERMARQAKVQLVLLARAQLPPRERWKNIASGDGGTTEERRRIRKLLAIESGGSAVLPVAADVTQLESVRAGVAEATRRFGRIHGVIHAAGAVDDGPMALKTDASIARVVGPKLLGLICLEEALRSSPPELLVLFSSTSSFLGLPGQADYAAANAILNAYARSGARLAQRTVAIQWGAWGAVGMAARAAGVVPPEPGGDRGEVNPDASHPLLGKVLRRGAGGALFEAQYAPSTHWVLDEHRLSTGEPIIPGTGYIEMARAAFAETFGPGPVEIRDLVFLAPLSGKDSPRRVRIELRAEGDGYAFSVASESDRGWVENARASIARASSAPPAARDLERLSAMCSSRSERFASDGKPTRQERYLRFGPRWKTLQETRYGDREALGVLELQAGFESDLASYSVHPAMLDLATACGFPLLHGYEQSDGLYVPFSYRAVRIHGPLPRRCWSHVRASDDSDASAETAAFDVTIFGPDGRVLVECDEFLVRRVDPSVIAGGATTDKAPSRSAASAPGAPRNGDGAGGSFLEEIVRTGILPDEGWEAIRRIVNGPPIPEVIVSSVALDLLRRRVEAAFGRRRAPAASRAGAASGAATADPTQAALAKMWEDLLGVNGVGADDDFFELGGHSLIAVRLLARIEKAFHKKLKLATLFEARTLRALADLLREGSPQTQQPAKWKSLVPIRGTGSSPTLFCVHGVGGEVLNFAALAARLGLEQPFIALRAPSHDGSSEPLRTVEQQAELYVKEITEYQPQGPYLLAGYSYGGLVALAMARLLAASGRRVSFLGVIDTWHKDSFVPSRGGVLAWLKNARRWLALDAWEPAKAAGVSPWRAAMRAVRTELERRRRARRGALQWQDLPGLPPNARPEDLEESMRRTLAANFEAFQAYEPQPHEGSITLFRAFAQPLFGCHQADLGWGPLATRGVRVVEIPGNHASCLQEPCVETLARGLAEALAEAAPAIRTAPESIVSVSREAHRVSRSSLAKR